ncbi:glycosyltransferase family 4 protein [Niabella sp. CC-SYL272]|uniref:glycosyltransferase family 4 protein n=1 Tax=Niabella agricola TaxID=2891571 RepID=UPI001F2DE6A6|nr:glycosyltransferase family 1 protein [Niabella agricola]MCF3108493.1 glycosyltransferase family 4 protein [Niabella agricola]
MNIAVNCWNLRNKNIDGIGNVIIETISRLIQQHPEIHFQLLCDKSFDRSYFDFPNARKHLIFPPYRHPLLYLFYLEGKLPSFLKKNKTDLFIGMDGMISLRTNCKQIAVMHDLNFEYHPKDLLLRNRLYYRFFFKRFAQKSSRIVAVSEYTKNDIMDRYHIDAGKIDVMYLGVKTIFHPLTTNEIQAVRNKYSNGLPYFFFVGSMHPRKNIPRLLAAFELFKMETGSHTKLLLAGNLQWKTDVLQHALQYLKYRDDIHFTGRVSDAELNQLLAASQGLVFVPTFEGFGLPIIEGFQAGVPVICSNTTSMPEVAGGAALLVNPLNTNEIAAAMSRVDTDKKYRIGLIEKGTLRKALFNWEQSSVQLYASILKTFGQ